MPHFFYSFFKHSVNVSLYVYHFDMFSRWNFENPVNFVIIKKKQKFADFDFFRLFFFGGAFSPGNLLTGGNLTC